MRTRRPTTATWLCRSTCGSFGWILLSLSFFVFPLLCAAQIEQTSPSATTNTASAWSSASTNAEVPAQGNLTGLARDLPETGASVLRVLGALALVLALFLGGVWFFRRWQEFQVRHSKAPKLQILEAKSLGNRQTLLVLRYEEQQMLVGAAPNGLTFLTHLPPRGAMEPGNPPETARENGFGRALHRALGGQA